LPATLALAYQTTNGKSKRKDGSKTGLAKPQAYVVEYAANVADLGPCGSIIDPIPATAQPSNG